MGYRAICPQTINLSTRDRFCIYTDQHFQQLFNSVYSFQILV